MSAADSDDPAGQAIDDGRGRIFPCSECGADLVFHIGQQKLKCPYCGGERAIELGPEAAVREQDFQSILQQLRERKEQTAEEHSEVRCESCGSDVVFEGTLTSTICPYCGSPIQRENVHRGGFRIPVDAVLPFQVEQQRAEQLLSQWVRTRWFAPNDFKRAGVKERFNGVYLPFWTFDALTFTRYVGERGEHYTVTVGTGKDQRTETRTRWYPASGSFQRFFDDLLVNATSQLPVNLIDNLAPWPLHKCCPFTPEYLAGFFARTYDVKIEEGFAIARERAENALREESRRRIGGDEQRLYTLECRYDAVSYKHLLLPVWMLAYRYRNKSFRVFVNAVTGEVQGARPYSWVKIVSAVLAVVAGIVAIAAALRN